MADKKSPLINYDFFKKYPQHEANKFFSPGTKITKGGRSRYGGHRVYDRGEHFEFDREEFWTEVQNALSDEKFNILMMKMKDYSQDKMAGEMGVDRHTAPRKIALLREKLRPIKEKYFPHAKPLTAEDKRKMSQHSYYKKKKFEKFWKTYAKKSESESIK